MKLRYAAPLFIPLFAIACSNPSASETPAGATSDDEIVNVPQTDVERQSIGNCWLYAHASWAESMHLTATGEQFDISQSYWTYWHWFDEIMGGYSDEISTGGSYTVANGIVRRYGLMPEDRFIAADATTEMSSRQKSALETINRSLKDGALSTYEARRDRALVRAELDRAWSLTEDVVEALDDVFGRSVSRTFSSTSSPAQSGDTAIIAPSTFAVAYPSGPGQAPESHTLLEAQASWQTAHYSRGDRRFQQRLQRALHDAQPVIITWFVDFNALENGQNELRGSFNMKTLERFGPGSQGGHMTVLEDYQVVLADGTRLAAGVTLDPNDVGDKELLDRALDRSTKIEFLRVKNSWGAARPDRAFAPGMPGYHDLYMDYLDGPVKQCSLDAKGDTDTSNCRSTTTPLRNVVLPPGY